MSLSPFLLLLSTFAQDPGTGPAAAGALPEEAPAAPEAASHKLRISREFGTWLYACEPAVTHPVALAWDEARRPWVGCTGGEAFERRGEEVGRDRIVVLRDADQDGSLETAETFVDGLRGLRSFVLHRGGVIIAVQGALVRVHDEDRDGRGDARTTLYEGFEDGAIVDDLTYGLDGWIYGSHRRTAGRSEEVRDAKEHRLDPLAGGVIRFRPDGSALELVSRSAAAPGGVAFDADGELFFSTSFGELRHVVLDETVLGRGRIGDVRSWAELSPGALQRVLEQSPAGSGGAAGDPYVGVGSLLYGAGTWPADYDGNYLSCDPVAGRVVRNTLRPRGVTFAARADEEPFLHSTDPWFRPWRLVTGPDGALYVLDYCQASTSSPRGYGRIFRVDHKDAELLPTIDLEGAETSLLIAALEHPGLWHRRTAQRLLSERELQSVELDAVIRTGLNSLDGRGRIHSLWTLAFASPRRMQKAGEAMLHDFRPNVRVNALRAARVSDAWDVLRMRKRIETLLGDPSPHVRLAALAALPGAFGKKMRTELLGIYRLAVDDWTRSAIFGVSSQTPVDFVESAFAWGDPRLDGLVRALVERIGREQDVRNAVGLIVAADRYHERSPKMVAASLNLLDGALDPDLKPWSSPTMRSTMRGLLRAGNVEVAYAALPFARRWVREGELRPDIETLELRLRDAVSNLEAARLVSRGFLESLTGSEDEEIARKARQRLRELEAEKSE